MTWSNDGESRRRSNATYNAQYRRDHSGEQDARHLLDGFGLSGMVGLPAIPRSATDGGEPEGDPLALTESGRRNHDHPLTG